MNPAPAADLGEETESTVDAHSSEKICVPPVCRDTGTSGFIYISDSDRTVPAELGKESQAFSCVQGWNSACLSSSSRDDRTLVDLCLESACFSVLCMGMSVPLRVVPSSTGFPSKRCAGIGFFSRVDREIVVFR